MPRRGKDKSKIFFSGPFSFRKRTDFPRLACFTRSFRAPISDRCPEGTVVSSDFDTFSSSDISPDSGSPQIPKESEGTAVLPIPKESERKARFYSLCPAGAEEKKTRVRGKPVLFLIFPPTPSESGEIRPFFSTPKESEKKDQEKGPSSAVENRKRFSTADGEKKNLGFVFAPSGN